MLSALSYMTLMSYFIKHILGGPRQKHLPNPPLPRGARIQVHQRDPTFPNPTAIAFFNLVASSGPYFHMFLSLYEVIEQGV